MELAESVPKLVVDFPFQLKPVFSPFNKLAFIEHGNMCCLLFLYEGGQGRCQESGPNEVPTVDGPKKPKVDTLPSTL